ncbi:hypothetical protein DSECCO2_441730 [anaerobic digester metagenome]
MILNVDRQNILVKYQSLFINIIIIIEINKYHKIFCVNIKNNLRRRLESYII